MYGYLKKIANCFLPYTCILCNNPSDNKQDLCQACQQLLPLLTKQCSSCALPLSSLEQKNLCATCILHPPLFNRAYALYHYKTPIKQLILELKFKHILINARILGEQIAHQIKNHWYRDSALPHIIIPVPLHESRLKQRGFNQALEIARPIAHALNRPIHVNAIKRLKSTQAQATLSALERRQNVKQAFSMMEHFPYKHIAIIDDVMTTGETIREICSTITQYNPCKIDIWCCAKASAILDE